MESQEGAPNDCGGRGSRLDLRAVGLLAVSAWTALSQFQDEQTSDALIPVMASLQHWTPFFWQQDRIGQLVPLIAMPLHHPLMNLVAQTAISVAFTWLTLYLAARYVDDGDPCLPAALGGIVLTVGLSPYDRGLLFGPATPYSTGMALTLLGMLALRPASLDEGHDKRRRISGWVLLILGEWVDIVAVLFSVPLVLHAATGSTRLRRHQIETLAAVFVATAASFAASASVHVLAPTPRGFVPLDQWGAAWWAYACQLVVDLDGRLLLPLLALALCSAGLAPRRVRRSVASLAAAALVTVVVTAVTRHLSGRAVHLTYSYPALLLLSAAGGLAVVRALEARVRWPDPRTAHLLATIAALMTCGWCFGRPGLDVVREGYERRCGAICRESLSGGATHFAGGYWSGWEIVFWMNELLYEQGDTRHAYAIIWRGEFALEDSMREYPLARIVVAGARADGEALMQARKRLPQARLWRTGERIRLYRAGP